MTSRSSFPLESIAPGQTLFVTGPSPKELAELSLAFVLAASESSDGLVFITTDLHSQGLLDLCKRNHPSFNSLATKIIDCTGQHRDYNSNDRNVEVEHLSDVGDLTALGIKFSVLYEHLIIEESTPVLSGIISLTTILEQVEDLRNVVRFLQMSDGRIKATGGLGIYSIDHSAHDDETISTVKQICDGGIEVRTNGEGDRELRVHGLPEQTGGWTPFSMSELSKLDSG